MTQKPYRRALMDTYGAAASLSPSTETHYRPRDYSPSARPPRQPRHRHLGSGGSGRPQRDDTKYALGSVLNHVLVAPDRHRPGSHRAVRVGQRTTPRDRELHRRGINFAGIAFPFSANSFAAGKKVRVVASSRRRAPASRAGATPTTSATPRTSRPLTKMHTLGSTFTPPGFHAGGLRTTAWRRWCRTCRSSGLISATAYHQLACFEAGVTFARAEASCRRRRRTTR